MTEAADEHERTMAFAEIALGQIKALRQAATPRNYEIWYTYATGYNPSLNQKINETLKAQRHAHRRQSRRHLRAYLSPTRLTDRIDKVGSQVIGEIEQVMAMIDAAAGSAIELHREPRRHVRTSSASRRTATACARSSKAWCRPPRTWRVQPAARRAAHRLQAGDQRAAGQSRGGAQREPDRSADPALQPQVLRHDAGAGHRGRARAQASRCR